MSERKFVTEVLGYMPEDEVRRRLRELAMEFHYQCEMFDRSVCSGSNKGIAMPTGPGERNRCDENFKRVREEMYEQFVVMLKVSPADWRNAISDHIREFNIQFREFASRKKI